MDEACDGFMRGKAKAGGDEVAVMAGPAAEPVCPPAGGKGGIQQGKTDRACGIGLFDGGNFLAGFRAGNDRDGQIGIEQRGGYYGAALGKLAMRR